MQTLPQMVTPTLTDISHANMRVWAKFASLNKQSDIKSYHEQVLNHQFTSMPCVVTHVATMTPEDYDIFTQNLLTDFDWLDGKGGCDSDMDNQPEGKFFSWTEEQQQEFKRHSYRLVVAISAPKRLPVYVDPQGYSYARYVGL